MIKKFSVFQLTVRWTAQATVFCRGAELHCHRRDTANVLYMHRINTLGAGANSAAAARVETQSYHHFVLYCPLLLWLPVAALCHAGGSKDHERPLRGLQSICVHQQCCSSIW